MKIFISYDLSKNDEVSLAFADTLNSDEIQSFVQLHPQATTFKTTTTTKDYNKEDALYDVAVRLWKQFDDVYVETVNDEQLIGDEFLHFNISTPVYEIWHWFEKCFDLSVATDLMGLD